MANNILDFKGNENHFLVKDFEYEDSEYLQ